MTCDRQRRRFIVGVAMTPLLLCGAKRVPPALTQTMTLTGQALIANDLCRAAYPGLVEVVAEVRRGDVAMTALETAIRTTESGSPTREGQFLHAARSEERRGGKECVGTWRFRWSP